MTKLEMLFVRACKSCNDKRIYSLYRRFYMAGKWNVDPALVSILLDICDKYCPLSSRKLIDGLNPQSIFNMSGNKDFYNLTLRVIMSHIRLTEASKFEGMIRPAIFRNREKLINNEKTI